MSKSDTLKSVVKKPADKSTYGTNPRDPWSAREGIAEDKALDTYLNTRGINPKFATKDVKIAHSKSNQFLNWKRTHMQEDFTDEEVDMLINEVLSKDATAGDWIHDFIHSDNPKFKGKSRKERQKMALGAYYAKQNESLGDDFLKMMKDKGIKHRVHGTPDQEKQRTVDKLAANKAKADASPAPKKTSTGTFGTTRGYGQGRYMGDSVELEGDTLDEVSSELLGRYKEKAKKSADDLTAVGKHRQASDRHMNVMKATGKQMGKTIANIKRALNKEDLMKSARIIKDIYKKKGIKEEMYDHEKDDKGSSSVYGKAPKMGKSKEEAESTNKAAAVLKGGTTLTGKSRDTVEIDPMMRTRPTNGASPEDARSKKSIG